MNFNDNDPFGPLLQKLARLAELDQGDREAVRRLPFRIAHAHARELLIREGTAPTDCCVLLEGYACRSKSTGTGARQILSFHFAGDILNLQNLALPQADHDVETISPARIAWIPSKALKELAAGHPNINDALWRDTLVDAAIFREWVLNVGRRDARSRIAHMLCEFAARREAAGLGSSRRFDLPMTQDQIADATGLTPIHVNRMLQALAADGLVSRDRRNIEILDWDRMRAVAGFDAAYLHAAA